MKFLILITLIAFNTIAYSQSVSNNTAESNPIKNNSYVIGVGNSDNSVYENILSFLQNNTAIDVYAICHSHNIIGFEVLNNEYKSYDVIRDLLESEFESLILLRKNESILTKDCSAEILKQ